MSKEISQKILQKFSKLDLLKAELQKLIEIALIEDRASDDITSDLILDDSDLVSFKINTRQAIILCGIGVIKYCFDYLLATPKFGNAKIKIDNFYQDGDFISSNSTIASGVGSAKLVFAAERVILNLIQHLSAISTNTNQFVKLLGDSKTKILDTRKTLPSLRLIQKYAVKIGGGENHRFCLDEMILIKDNHIAAAGSVTNALRAVKAKNSKQLKVEIECDNLDQIIAVLKEGGADIIMLDNMALEQIKLAKEMIRSKAKIEVSGGVNLANIAQIAKIGVDFISIGVLTHSVVAVDIGLDIVSATCKK
jgi:nicotinate-nucleotide pyrophosphorylase (carboxylating)